MDIDKKVIELLSEISDKAPIASDDTLQYDIGLDSLAMVMLLVSIEDTFGFELNESDMNPFDLVTVKDVIDLARRYCDDQRE